jgi:hypothetical protein
MIWKAMACLGILLISHRMTHISEMIPKLSTVTTAVVMPTIAGNTLRAAIIYPCQGCGSLLNKRELHLLRSKLQLAPGSSC